MEHDYDSSSGCGGSVGSTSPGPTMHQHHTVNLSHQQSMKKYSSIVRKGQKGTSLRNHLVKKIFSKLIKHNKINKLINDDKIITLGNSKEFKKIIDKLISNNNVIKILDENDRNNKKIEITNNDHKIKKYIYKLTLLLINILVE
jgi:ribosomal protein L17